MNFYKYIWLWRSLEGGHGNTLQHSCLKNPMDRGAWWVQSIGSKRVRHHSATNNFTFTTLGSLLHCLFCLFVCLFVIIGLAKRSIWVFHKILQEKTEWIFCQAQYILFCWFDQLAIYHIIYLPYFIILVIYFIPFLLIFILLSTPNGHNVTCITI